jgi:predicted small secreted protein
MRLRRRSVVAVLVLVLVFPVVLAADCNTWQGVGVAHTDEYGYFCGGEASGCTECVNFHPGGVQSCVYITIDYLWCTDWGSDFQW